MIHFDPFSKVSSLYVGVLLFTLRMAIETDERLWERSSAFSPTKVMKSYSTPTNGVASFSRPPSCKTMEAGAVVGSEKEKAWAWAPSFFNRRSYFGVNKTWLFYNYISLIVFGLFWLDMLPGERTVSCPGSDGPEPLARWWAPAPWRISSPSLHPARDRIGWWQWPGQKGEIG